MNAREQKFEHECSAENAPRFAEWIAKRGGVAVWGSVNLSNPGASWSTPALKEDGSPMPKPNWQASEKPRIVTDAAHIGVCTDKLFKAFRVSVRVSGSGMMLKLTDASQRRLDKTMKICEQRHGSAHYRKGVLDIDAPSMGVYYTDGIVPLNEWRSS